MKIALTYNLKKKDSTKPADYFSECDSEETINAIISALKTKGHSVDAIDVEYPSLFSYFRKNRVDIVFNIAEGKRGKFRESEVPAVLDYLNIPYTGSNTFSLALALNKALTKKILKAENIPTPQFQLFSKGTEHLDPSLKFPLIVKPNCEGSAKGINKSNVVETKEELFAKAKEIIGNYKQEALVEEFIEGKELTVGILENGKTTILPILEIDFSSCKNSGEFFYSWRMKEYQGNRELGLVPTFHCPARLDRQTEALVKQTALKTHHAVGCFDISRTDIRLNKDNVPYVLEINPLPGLDPHESNFPIMAYAAGMKYEDLIESILMSAAKRKEGFEVSGKGVKLSQMNNNAVAVENQKIQLEVIAQPKPIKRPRDYQQISLYKDVNPLDWEDWHWQLKHRICNKEELTQIIKLTPEEEKGIDKAKGRLAMAITPYWGSLLDPEDPSCPIRRQAVPVQDESLVSPHEMVDPCAEDRDSPAPHLVHRYPDRVLLLATDHCAMYCRHCTRRRLVGDHEEKDSDFTTRFDAAIEYIKQNRKVRDVLISGGDPLILEDEQLESLLQKIRAISHVEFLRLGTRMPVTLPQRITEKLVNMLKKYSPIWMSIHFNHPKEITKRCKIACDMLAEAGIPLGSQTVLLKGINDRPFIMKKLVHELLQIRVRPYYIYQCDPVRGTQHFRTPVAVGINIMEKLRGHTSGYAIPTYVIDGPGGGGKIPVGPNYILSQAKGKYVLRNYKGKIYTYLE